VTSQIDGFVGDNNVFGLVLVLVVAMLMGLRTTLPDKKLVRLLFFVFIMFIVLCIIYTQSRGAFAAMGTVLFLGSLMSSRPFRNLLILMTIVVAGYLAIPSEYFERLSSLSDLSSDISAMGRFENWELAWKIALEHPLFGVGLENHIPYNITVVRPDVQVRVAHNVYLQVLAETGFPGLILYLMFIWASFWSLVRTWRMMIPVAENHADLTWVRDTAFWMVCGYVGYILGAGFLNMLYIEFPWYAIFYSSMLQPLVEQELNKRKQILPEPATQNE
jgi:probable O-glycosylation ligase (exosortase A-associated)